MYTFRPWDDPTDAERKIGKYTDSIDMQHPGNKRDSANYYRTFLKDCYHADGDKDLMFYAINQITLPGPVLEFGTWKGYSINYIAGQLPDRTIYGFDVFNTDSVSFKDGENWNNHDFTQAKLPLVKSNVELTAGWFHQTLPDFMRDHNERCSLVHIDCDNYAGTIDVFKHINIGKGTIIVFDEYINVPNWRNNEHKAWKEQGLKFEYIAVNTKHQQVAVKIL